MSEATTPNPNGANQYLPDPRQSLFISKYFDPESETFSNALRSAIAAGYDEDYARQLVARMPSWLLDKVQDNYLVDKAEKNLKEFIEMETKNIQVNKKGEEYTYNDPQLVRIKADVSKFALEKLKRDKYGDNKQPSGTTINGNVNILNIQGLNDEQLEARLAEIRARRTALVGGEGDKTSE